MITNVLPPFLWFTVYVRKYTADMSVLLIRKIAHIAGDKWFWVGPAPLAQLSCQVDGNQLWVHCSDVTESWRLSFLDIQPYMQTHS